MIQSYILKIRFNMILPSTPGSFEWPLSLRFSHQSTVYTSPLLLTCYMSCSFHSSWIFSCSRPHVLTSYIPSLYFFTMAQQPIAGQGLITKASWSHSETRTIGRTPLGEGSARRRDIYLTTHYSNPQSLRLCGHLYRLSSVCVSSSSSSVICQTTGPKPLPKWFLHIVRSRASSFNW